MNLALLVTEAVIGVPLVLVAYIAGAELVAGRLPARLQRGVRPWIWAGPALVIVFLLYPIAQTVWFSFRNGRHFDIREFVGLDNYRWVLGSDQVHAALLNNLLWLVLVPSGVLVVGTLIAVLSDRVRYEVAVKFLV